MNEGINEWDRVYFLQPVKHKIVEFDLLEQLPIRDMFLYLIKPRQTFDEFWNISADC